MAKLDANEYADMKAKAARVEELEKKVKAFEDAHKPAPQTPANEEAERLKNELKQVQEEQRKAKTLRYRGDVESLIAEEVIRQNIEKFKGAFGKLFIEETTDVLKTSLTDIDVNNWLDDDVYGKDKMTKEIQKRVNAEMTKRNRLVEEVMAKSKRDSIANSIAKPFQINSLDRRQLERGQLHEEAYLSDQASQADNALLRLQKVFMSKVWGVPVIFKGRDLYEETLADPRIGPLVEQQHRWEISDGVFGTGQKHWLSPGGRLYEMINNQINKRNILLLEADEATTTNFLGGTGINQLPIDVSGAIVLTAYKRLLAREIAAVVEDMQSTTKRIYEIMQPRDEEPVRIGRHWFGGVDATAAAVFDTTETLPDGTVVDDEGPLLRTSNQFPAHAYAYLGETANADAVITVTGTDQSGDSATGVVKFLATDPVGTIRRIIPVIRGTMWMDLSAVASTGWSTTGEVGFFVADEVGAHVVGGQAQKARLKAYHYDVSEREYALHSSVDRNLIEDTSKALAAGGGPGLNYVAMITEMISNEVMDFIDLELFDDIVQNTYSYNIASFNGTVPADGASVTEWKEQLHFQLADLISATEYYSGARPDYMCWNSNDEPVWSEWLRGNRLSVFAPEVNDPFANSRARYSIAGCNVYTSQNVPLKRIIVGSRSKRSGIVSLTYIPLMILSADNPNASFQAEVMVRTRGFHGVPSQAGQPEAGRTLGVLKVTR